MIQHKKPDKRLNEKEWRTDSIKNKQAAQNL